MDVCRGHGTFLDKGELHQVVQFILDGGLDRARQRERDDLVEQLHRLQQLERDQALFPASGSTSGWNDGSLRRFLAALRR